MDPPRSAPLTIGQFASSAIASTSQSSKTYPFGYHQLDDVSSDGAKHDGTDITTEHRRSVRQHSRGESIVSRRSRSLARPDRKPLVPSLDHIPALASGHLRSASTVLHSPTSPHPSGAAVHSRSSSRSASAAASRASSRPASRGSTREHSYSGQTPSTPRQFAHLISHAAASIVPLSHPTKPSLLWRAWRMLKPWLPLLAYGATSLGFLIAMAFWKTQVFTGLDHLSNYLKRDGWAGYFVLYGMIVVTTIPPVPLYSTLIILSGYTFGAVHGLLISYSAALSGAVGVFLISRFIFKDSITRWFAQFIYLKRVVRAIEKRPKLLFLIRLAPYPYNVLNCLLAASPLLTWQTYTICTALSLFKLIIHTTIGSTIHSFSRHYLNKPPGDPTNPSDPTPADPEPEKKSPIGTISTVVGIILCVGIFAYLSYVARKAVDEELGDEDGGANHDSEEHLPFIDGEDREDDIEARTSVSMSESPFRSELPMTPRTHRQSREVHRVSNESDE